MKNLYTKHFSCHHTMTLPCNGTLRVAPVPPKVFVYVYVYGIRLHAYTLLQIEYVCLFLPFYFSLFLFLSLSSSFELNLSLEGTIITVKYSRYKTRCAAGWLYPIHTECSIAIHFGIYTQQSVSSVSYIHIYIYIYESYCI